MPSKHLFPVPLFSHTDIPIPFHSHSWSPIRLQLLQTIRFNSRYDFKTIHHCVT